MLLLAPLARKAGGWELCRDLTSGSSAPVFSQRNEADYQALLAMINAGADFLKEHKRFDMPGFVPRSDWVREMKRYGVLPECVTPEDVTDVYAMESKYWESLWHQPGIRQPAGQ